MEHAINYKLWNANTSGDFSTMIKEREKQGTNIVRQLKRKLVSDPQEATTSISFHLCIHGN